MIESLEESNESDLQELVDQAIAMSDAELVPFLESLSKPIRTIVAERLCEAETLDEFPTVVETTVDAETLEHKTAQDDLLIGDSLGSESVFESKPDAFLLLQTAAFLADKQSLRSDQDDCEQFNSSHSLKVAALLAEQSHIENVSILQAAILMDAARKNAVTANEITLAFGSDVSVLVAEANEGANAGEKFQIDIASRKSHSAKQLWIADLICRIIDLGPSASPRETASNRKTDDEKRQFIRWSKQVVDACRDADSILAHRFDQIVAEARFWFA